MLRRRCSGVRTSTNEFYVRWRMLKKLVAQRRSPRYPRIVTKARPTFAFVDLFAGIGGFRIALERAGGECVFSCDWDKYARITYETNFGTTPAGDIRTIHADDIPRHDVVTA